MDEMPLDEALRLSDVYSSKNLDVPSSARTLAKVVRQMRTTLGVTVSAYEASLELQSTLVEDNTRLREERDNLRTQLANANELLTEYVQCISDKNDEIARLNGSLTQTQQDRDDALSGWETELKCEQARDEALERAAKFCDEAGFENSLAFAIRGMKSTKSVEPV